VSLSYLYYVCIHYVSSSIDKASTGVLLAIPDLAGFVSLASLALGVVDPLVLAHALHVENCAGVCDGSKCLSVIFTMSVFTMCLALTDKASTGVLLAIPDLAGFVSLASLALGVVDPLVSVSQLSLLCLYSLCV
jgi:hypothetical protein